MSLQPGSILRDRYRIEDQLGKGGMGAVYTAHDLTLDLLVAVKENLSENPDAERQFLREARILAELRHPNLPRVTDHFVLEGRQYLVMDFIAGEDLHTRVQRQPPSVEEVLGWADQVCSALSYLHRQSPPVIHRDIKPPNLKLQPDGSVVLVDFGLAKTFDQAVTATGARGLTPGYSPPEQYGTQRTDSRSDQFALAATLYNLLTQQRPVDSIERIMKKAVLKPVREINPAVPEHVDLAIQRALSLDPEERFPDVDSFRTALKGLLGAETIQAPTLTPLIERPRRSRLPLILGGGTLVAIVIIVGVALASGIIPGVGRQASPTLTQPPIAAIAATSTPSPTSAPSSTAPPPTATPTHEPSVSPTATVPPSLTPVPMGGGGRIAFISDRADNILQIWTMNPDGSDPRQLTFGPGDKTQPSWSPDGSQLLYVTYGGQDAYGNDLGMDIKVINADGTGIDWVVHEQGDDTDPAWSPDGRFIAFASTRTSDLRQVYIIDASCLQVTEGCLEAEANRVSCHSEFCAVEFSPAWAPEGITYPDWLPASHNLAVAVSINQAPAKIFLRPPSEVIPKSFDLSNRIVGVDHLTWSPDGNLLAFTWHIDRGTNEVYVAPISDRGANWTRLTTSNGNKEPSFSPDGKWIVFTSTRDQNPEVYVMIANGTGQENLTKHPGRDMQPDWQPATE